MEKFRNLPFASETDAEFNDLIMSVIIVRAYVYVSQNSIEINPKQYVFEYMGYYYGENVTRSTCCNGRRQTGFSHVLGSIILDLSHL